MLCMRLGGSIGGICRVVIRDKEKLCTFPASYHIYMQEKTITIPFDLNEFRRSQKIIWSFSYKKVIKGYILYSITSAIILTIEYASEGKDPFQVGIILGWALFIYSLLKWSELFERRKKYFERVEIALNRFAEESMSCTFTFAENEIEYRDKEKLYRLNCSLFDPYLILKDHILLIAQDTKTIMFTIGKNEVGNENYSEICDILNEKIGFDKALK
jgi:hypothetical protein